MSRKGRMRVALVSTRPVAGDIKGNLANLERWLKKALARRPDFVGFPEFALTGWVYDPGQMLTVRSPELKVLDGWARRHGVFIAAGFVEKRGRVFHNTAIVTGPRGRVGFMRKINLIHKEGLVYSPGREFPVFKVAGCTMGVTTCADASYFEMMRILSYRGAEVIFAPHANSLVGYGNNRAGWVRWRTEQWPAFAKASCVYIAGMSLAGLSTPARRGEEPYKYCGGGMVMDWNGKAVATLTGRNKREGMIVADLDIAALRKARKDKVVRSEFRPQIVYNRPGGWIGGHLD